MEQDIIKVYTRFDQETETYCYNLFKIVKEIPDFIYGEKVVKKIKITPLNHNQQNTTDFNYYKLFSNEGISFVAIKKEEEII
jgi:hypothetical protein